MSEVYFASRNHKEQFLSIIRSMGKHDGGRIDKEYGAAIYLLTSPLLNFAESFSDGKLTFPSPDGLSSGEKALIRLAENLFYSPDKPIFNVSDFTRLSEPNYKVAMAALEISYYPCHLAENGLENMGFAF